jgi:hypothetical protein
MPTIARAEKSPVTMIVTSWFRQGPRTYLNVVVLDGEVQKSELAAAQRDHPRHWTVSCDNCGGLDKGLYYGTLDRDKVELRATDMKGKTVTPHFRVFSHDWVRPTQ